MSKTKSTDTAEWITLAEACRILEASPGAVKSVAISGALRTHGLPGTRIRYSRADAERLAADPRGSART